jgi:uncharacterized protein (DUF111 family)
MRTAYLDCFSGMSGDMFLGALVDVGVSPQLFQETVAALNIGAKLDISLVSRAGISATKVDVLVHGEKELPRELFWEQRAHEHEHAHGGSDHHHGHRNEPVQLREHNYAQATKPHDGETRAPSSGAHEHGHSHGRGLSEIREIIANAALSEKAKKNAIGIFDALGTAEAKIHNTDIETIHFHEVGSADAIVDIVCASIGVEALGVDEIVCSPLNVGSGTVKCMHGTLPVPAPATLELLKGVPVYFRRVPRSSRRSRASSRTFLR